MLKFNYLFLYQRIVKVFLLIVILNFPLLAHTTDADKSVEQKKILIISCKAGYGHEAAVKTLRALLETDYVFSVAYPFDEEGDRTRHFH